jgi:undecaprenyl diphosphate synthase
VIHERLPRAVAPDVAPRHVAIIMDGNRRWAAAHGLPALEGHRRGLAALRDVVAAAAQAGVDVLTAYAFSEENWHRPAAEVRGLMELAAFFARGEAAALARENVRVRILGRRDRLPAAVERALRELETRTVACTGLVLNLAVDYSARTELADAVRGIAADVLRGVLDPQTIDDAAIASRLHTAGQPDPDLLVRTGGDLRLSNFLLYQCAYTELFSTPVPWPDFNAAAFTEALATFAARQRRYGR